MIWIEGKDSNYARCDVVHCVFLSWCTVSQSNAKTRVDPFLLWELKIPKVTGFKAHGVLEGHEISTFPSKVIMAQLRSGVVSNSGINLKNYCQKLAYHLQTPQFGIFCPGILIISNYLRIVCPNFLQSNVHTQIEKKKKSCYWTSRMFRAWNSTIR